MLARKFLGVAHPESRTAPRGSECGLQNQGYTLRADRDSPLTARSQRNPVIRNRAPDVHQTVFFISTEFQAYAGRFISFQEGVFLVRLFLLGR